MLTTLEVVIYVVGVVVLLPLLAYSLIAGSGVPENSWFAKYYRAERFLNPAGTLFLLAVCANAVARLGLHFGYIDPRVTDRLMLLIGLVFGATLLAYLVLWIRAALRVHRSRNNAT